MQRKEVAQEAEGCQVSSSDVCAKLVLYVHCASCPEFGVVLGYAFGYAFGYEYAYSIGGGSGEH